MADLRLQVLRLRFPDDPKIERTTGPQPLITRAIIAYTGYNQSLGGAPMVSNLPGEGMVPFIPDIKRWAKKELAGEPFTAFRARLQAALDGWSRQKRKATVEETPDGIRFTGVSSRDRALLLAYNPGDEPTWDVIYNFLDASSLEAATHIVAQLSPAIELSADNGVMTVDVRGIQVEVLQRWTREDPPARPHRQRRGGRPRGDTAPEAEGGEQHAPAS